MQKPAEATESVWQGDWELNCGTESSLFGHPETVGAQTVSLPSPVHRALQLRYCVTVFTVSPTLKAAPETAVQTAD